MRTVALLVLLASTTVSAQTDGRVTFSGSAVLQGALTAEGAGYAPAGTASASYRLGDGDRLGAFVLLSPESVGIPGLVAVGGAWDVLITRTPFGPYVTAGVAVVRQAELEAVSSCSFDDFCFESGRVKGFTSAAAVLGGGARFDLGRGGFVRTDVQVLAGPELVRPCLSLGGGVRL